MQSSAQSTTQERQSSRQSSAQSMQSSAQSQQGERQQSWQSNEQQQQQSRQSYATQHQQSWQSYGQQQQENRQNWADDYHGGCCYHGYSSGGAFAVGALTGLALGTAITAAQFNASTAAKTPVVVNNVTYYQVGSTWYQPQYQGGQLTYVVVNPPQQAPTTVVVPPPSPPQPGAGVPGGTAAPAPAYVMGGIYPTLLAGCIFCPRSMETDYLCGNTWSSRPPARAAVSYRADHS